MRERDETRWRHLRGTARGTQFGERIDDLLADVGAAHLISGHVFATNCWVPHGAEGAADITWRALPGMALIRLDLPELIRRWPPTERVNYMHIGLVEQGRIELRTRRRRDVYGPGEAYLFPRWDWVRLHAAPGTRVLNISGRRDRLAREGAPHVAEHILGYPGDLQRQFFALADQALATPPLHAASDEITEAALAALMAGMLRTSVPADAAGEPAGALVRRARALIDERHTDPELTPESIARCLHVSLRHLQRAFAQHGATVSTELRTRRMRTAARLMSGGVSASWPRRRIAKEAGFGTPHRLRAALRVDAAPSSSD
ncbi:hypothetical protein M4I32_07160 [Microbacterium sp. LRZ72]|uniref:AraC family ligand binding domain-containing protein n=1 Tax=Microbacterium sp. LRZ72 TaxID=2942481 RepID=UPI0029AC6C3F|nr:AraC family ligand binding domain-containing protein [Microbacterium sp. LRZ72]MDX2376576.1 hypothetical protein [Microbacterium sp. LRZ72]